MPPILAAFLCTLAILGLLIRDVKAASGVSPAIWIPVIWILLIGSRLPSEWIFGQYSVANPYAYADGSPLDRNIFLLLIAAGIAVLIRRRVEWSRFLRDNPAVTIFFAYALVSIIWSDYPFVAFKRWIKVFGHVVMALVVLTDPQPSKAFAAVIKRCAYVLLPLSVLFIKYYPELGRGFDNWTGAPINPGVTTNKNSLGNLILVTMPFMLAMWFSRSRERSFDARLDNWISLVFLVAAGWLLMMADSSAATVSTVAAIAIVFVLQKQSIRQHFSAPFLSVLAIFLLLLSSTTVRDSFILALGEDTTLTGRTELWEDLQRIKVNPILGTGFESFWLGSRVAPLWAKYWWQPNQAHNGYYEMYLNLGILGLIALAAMIVSTYRRVRREMLAEPAPDAPNGDASNRRSHAVFKFAFLIGLLAFNMTDATFKGLHLSFFVFVLAALHDPVPSSTVEPTTVRRVAVTGGRARRIGTLRPRSLTARRHLEPRRKSPGSPP